MFYPQAMTEIEIIVPAKDLLAVTKVLSGRGTFHQVDSGYLSPEIKSTTVNTWQEKAIAYTGLERRIQNIIQALGIEEGNPPKSEFETLVQVENVGPVVGQIEQEVKKITELASEEHKNVDQLQSILNQLEPVADIDLDISALRNPHFLFSMLGSMPAANMERLQTSLFRVPFVFLPLRQDNQNAVVWLVGAKNNADILERAARSAYLNPLILPDVYHGTPAAIITSLKKNIEDSQKVIEAQKSEIAHLRKTYEKQIQSLLWEVRSSRMLTDAITRYGRLQYTYVVVGWAISAGVEDLRQRIKQVSKEAMLEAYPAKRDGDNQNVPVYLQHAKALLPFQSLVTTYARPRYGELDPTWLIVITFPLLYGAMFGDLGQGLVLALLGWLIASRKVKALRSMAGLGGLIMACGLVAAVFGVLYGSVFGFEEGVHPLWMRPTDNIITILVIAIGAGLVILSIGFLLGIYNAWRMKEWGKMLFDHNGVAGLVLYWSILGLAGSVTGILPIPSIVFVVLLVLSGIAIMFAEVFKNLLEGHRPLIEGGIGTYLIQAFFELFEALITYLSNSLSYVRVGAFAVAHGGLSSAILILATLVSADKGIGYWIVVLIGNIFIIGFEGLIVGIQTMRLSYYEFFSKFFTGGGARFEPLKLYPSKEE
jgi:V/A-type H+/Na+-transporting ATPase subunit I